MAARFIRDEWTVGNTACGGGGVGSRVNKATVGGALDKANGDRLKWEAWMVFVWMVGATLGAGAIWSLGGGGGEVRTGGGGGIRGLGR